MVLQAHFPSYEQTCSAVECNSFDYGCYLAEGMVSTLGDILRSSHMSENTFEFHADPAFHLETWEFSPHTSTDALEILNLNDIDN